MSSQSQSRKLGAVLIAAFLGWMFDGLEMGLFPLIARPALLEMHGIMGSGAADAYVGHWMGVITAAFLLGAAAGGLVFGWLGDKIGRVHALAASILTYSLFTGFTYFVKNPEQLTVIRFIAALGMGGEWSLGVALVMEVWPERFRPMLAGIIGAAANIGFSLIAIVGLFVHVTQDSWRWVAIVGATPALLTFVVRLFVPESEKWEQAAKAAPTQPLKEVFSGRYRGTMMLGIAFSGIVLIGTWGSVQWLPLWADKLTGGQDPEAKAWTGLLSGLGAIIGCIGGGWLGGQFKRRVVYFTLCLASLVVCALLFRGTDAYGTKFLTLTFLAGMTSASFYGWLPLYLPELFPTRIRATAQGIAYNTGRIFAAFGALYMGQLMQTFNGSYARAGAIVTLIYILGMIVIWFAPETKGKPLPE
ncbi:MAG: MFS transporter [Opitutaceae bacterium]|nr:MFS transporter [Opitutaceae bacterium]